MNTSLIKKHRLFVALPAPPALKRTLGEWQSRFTDRPVRWVADRNIHLTLVPPWYEKEPAKVAKRLEGLAAVSGTLAFRFHTVTIGPNPREPRLIWALAESPPELKKLQKNLLGALGFWPPRQDLRAHLTLARFRPRQFNALHQVTLNEHIDWPTTFDSFALMESHLRPTGAEYEIIQTFPL